jgi:hypothetical protein
LAYNLHKIGAKLLAARRAYGEGEAGLRAAA